MAYSKTIHMLALLIYLTTSAYIYIPVVNIDPLILYSAQVACDRVQGTLRRNYGTVNQNDRLNLRNVKRAYYYLIQLQYSEALRPYRNIIVG